jgi:uncharacterized Zn-finger protein
MTALKRGCGNQSQQVLRAELPLCCPRHDERVWDAHPRIYLPIDEAVEHKLVCPYCGTHYHLID